MTWRAVARKDFSDAIRAKTIWALSVVFVGLFVVITFGSLQFADGEFRQFVEPTAAVVALLLPLVSIALGYASVIGERESGSLVLLLSFPHSRRDIVTGKFAGRSLVVGLPVIAGMAVAGVLVLLLYESVRPLRYLLFAGLNVVYGMAFLGIAICLSMVLSTSRRVTAVAFGVYLVFVLLWQQLIDLLVVVLWRFDASILADLPDWALFAKMAGPIEAYNRLVTALFDLDLRPQYTAADAPWLVDAPVAGLVLVGWIVLPLVAGYWRFKDADL